MKLDQKISNRDSSGLDHKSETMAGPLMSPAEVAGRLRITIRMTYKLIRERRLRVIRIGRLIRIHQSELETFLEEEARKSNSL